MDSTVAAPDTPFLNSSRETVTEETIKVLLKSASESSRLVFADLALRTDEILIMLADEIQNVRSALHLQEANFNNCIIYTKDKGFELLIETLCEQQSLEIFIARKSDLQPDIGVHMEKLITTSGKLRVLDLNGNSLQSTGVTGLSKAFYRNIQELPNDSSLFCLQFLHLSYNNIGDSGVLALCRGLVQFARRSFATSRPCRMRCLALSGNHLTDKAAYCLAQLLNTKYIGSTSQAGGNSVKIHSPKGLFNHFQFPLEELQLEDNLEITGRGLTALLGDVKLSMYSPLKRLKAAHCAIDCAAVEGLATVLSQQSSPLLELLDISMTESIATKCIQQSAAQFSRVYGTPIAQSLHGSLKRLSDTLLQTYDTPTTTQKPRFTLILGSLHRVIFEHACSPSNRNEQEDCLRALEGLNPAGHFFSNPSIPRILGSIRDWVTMGIYEVPSHNGNSHSHHRDSSSNVVAMEIEVPPTTVSLSSESFFASPSPKNEGKDKDSSVSGGKGDSVNSLAKQAFLQRMASRRSNSSTTAEKEEKEEDVVIGSPYSDTSGPRQSHLSSLQELKVVDQVTPRQSRSNLLESKQDNNSGSKKEKKEKQTNDRYGNKIGLSSSSHHQHNHNDSRGVSFGSHTTRAFTTKKSSTSPAALATTNNKQRYNNSSSSSTGIGSKTRRTKKEDKDEDDGDNNNNPLLSLSTELRLALNPTTTNQEHEPTESEQQLQQLPLSAQVRGVLGDLSSRLALIATQQRQRDDLRARHVTQALLVHQMAVEKEQEKKLSNRNLSSKLSMKSSQKTEKDDDDDDDDDESQCDSVEEDVEELLDSDSLSPSPPANAINKHKDKQKNNVKNNINKGADQSKHHHHSKKKGQEEEKSQGLTAESVAAMIEARLTAGRPALPPPPPAAAASAAASSTAMTTTTTTTAVVEQPESEAELLRKCQAELEVLRTVSSSRDTSLAQKLQSLEHRLLRVELALTGSTTSANGGGMNAMQTAMMMPMLSAAAGYSQNNGHGHSGHSQSQSAQSTKKSRPMAIETRLIQQLGGLHLLDHQNTADIPTAAGGGGGQAWVNELGHRLEAIEQMLRADKQFHQQQTEEDLQRKIEDRRALRHRWIEALASQQPLPLPLPLPMLSTQQSSQQQESDRDEVESVASIYSLPRYHSVNKGNSNSRAMSVPETPVATTQLHSISKDSGMMYPQPLTPSHLPPLPFMSAALHSHSSDTGNVAGGAGSGKERFNRPVIPEYEFATLRPPSGSWDAYDSSHHHHYHNAAAHGQARPGSSKMGSSISRGKSYMQSTNSSRKLKQYGATTSIL